MLVSINQSPFFIYFCYNFSTELNKPIYTWNKIKDAPFANIDFFYFSSFIFKANHGFIEEKNPSEKSCYSWGRTRWYWYRWQLKLQDLTRLVFVDEESENLRLVNDGEEFTRIIN